MNEKVIVLHPLLTSSRSGDGEDVRKFERNPEAALEEAVGLAHAIDLEVVHSEMVKLKAATSARLLLSGTVQRIPDLIHHYHHKDEKVGLVFVDYALSPVQQRNLEKE